MTRQTVILALVLAVFVTAWWCGVFWLTAIIFAVLCATGANCYWLGWDDCKADERERRRHSDL